MKYYETNFEEYIHAVEKFNMHPEMEKYSNSLPQNLKEFENLIIYGPAGVGKYSQMLKILKRYSPTELKHTKRITIQTEKQNYTYHMSDIHYEIDMSFLGCNSKLLWHELYFQIVDIVCTRPEKIGIIVCKNFHMIHSELLEIFYRYIQQYNNSYMNIQIKFVILTEHISFLPTNVLEICHIIPVKRPKEEYYIEMISSQQSKSEDIEKQLDILENIEPSAIMNLKEIRSFSHMKTVDNIPVDIFNIVCDQIIENIESTSFDFLQFRDALYDILIYNLDLTECFWYIFSHFISKGSIDEKDVSEILKKTYPFLKYYNNNYRPIYHLESIFFFLIMKINKYGRDTETKSLSNSRIKSLCKRSNTGTNKKAISASSSKISPR